MYLSQKKWSSPLAMWSHRLIFWGGRRSGHCCMGYLGAQALHRMGRESQGRFPYHSPWNYSISLDCGVTKSWHLRVLSLLPLPTGFIQTHVNFLLQVYAQLDFDNASRGSWAVLSSITASPLGRFYISNCAEKHTFHIYFNIANRALPGLWRLPGHRVSALLCFSVAMSDFVFKMPQSTYPGILTLFLQ